MAARQRRDPGRHADHLRRPGHGHRQVAVLPDARGDAHADEPRQRRRDRARAAEPDRPPPCPASPASASSSAARGDWDDETSDRYSVTYRWFRGSTAIPNQTAGTYTITARTSSRTSTAASAPRTRPRPRRPVAHPPADNIVRARRSPGTRACSARSRCTPRRLGRHGRRSLRGHLLVAPQQRRHPRRAAANYTVEHDDMDKALYLPRQRRTHRRQQRLGLPGPAAGDRPAADVRPPHLRGELTLHARDVGRHPRAALRGLVPVVSRSSTPINGATGPGVRARHRRPQPLHQRAGRRPRCSATAPPQRCTCTARRHGGAGDRGHRHPRRELTCMRGEWNDSRQAVRAELPVAAQQPADPRRRRAGPHRGRRGRRRRA